MTNFIKKDDNDKISYKIFRQPNKWDPVTGNINTMSAVLFCNMTELEIYYYYYLLLLLFDLSISMTINMKKIALYFAFVFLPHLKGKLSCA